MIITCPSCQTRYRFDEAKLGDRLRARSRCAKCGGSIEIANPYPADVPAAPAAEEPAPAPPPPAPEDTKRMKTLSGATAESPSHTITGKDVHKLGVASLPSNKRFSLAVIQGSATGQIFVINKTRTTLGRVGMDVNLDDPEASRQHAAVEIVGDTWILRDLGSTNGTFVDAERVETQVLTNHMEFRIGSHVLMFIVTDVE
jgi:predicted Zn finger-like uncharacterized protein